MMFIQKRNNDLVFHSLYCIKFMLCRVKKDGNDITDILVHWSMKTQSEKKNNLKIKGKLRDLYTSLFRNGKVKAVLCAIWIPTILPCSLNMRTVRLEASETETISVMSWRTSLPGLEVWVLSKGHITGLYARTEKKKIIISDRARIIGEYVDPFVSDFKGKLEKVACRSRTGDWIQELIDLVWDVLLEMQV